MKPKYIVVILGLLAVLLSVYLIAPEWFGLCSTHDRGDGVLVCESPFERGVGDPLLPLSSVFLSASIVMLVATRKTFSRWMKFSIGYAVVITALLFAMPNIGYGMGGFGFTILDTQGFAILYAILYALVSLMLLAVSEFLERRKR